MLEGVVTRKVGSGSYVADIEESTDTKNLGLLVPGLGRGEIFEPICAKIAERAAAEGFTLSWGGSSLDGHYRDELLRNTQQLIAQRADGVFFQPLELHPDSERTNVEVVKLFADNKIPVVLLDSDYLPFPGHSRFDVVGIDNVRAGFLAAKHLIAQGAARVDFVVRPFTAKTAVLRRYGYRLALLDHGIEPNAGWEHSIDTRDEASCRELIDTGAQDIVCVSDETAAYLMASLEKFNTAVPEAVRLVGFDDLKFAHWMRVPLTTLHQPCAAIGELAMDTMLTRMEDIDRVGRKILSMPN